MIEFVLRAGFLCEDGISGLGPDERFRVGGMAIEIVVNRWTEGAAEIDPVPALATGGYC